MTDFLFDPVKPFGLPVVGRTELFPVGRIFCVGRNYEAHAIEMGGVADPEAPFYFTKSSEHAILSGASIPFALGTQNLHHEMEFAVLLGRDAFRVAREDAMQSVFGYCCALDMTRRDLQNQAKDKRRPWDLGKDFEGSAVFAPAIEKSDFGEIGSQTIVLEVNGEFRQAAHLPDMIHSVPDIISHLSRFYHLHAGDIILTGTPAGVGAVQAGDRLTGQIDGLPDIALTLMEPE